MVFQLGSTLLDACVLAILSRQDYYGYGLTTEVKQVLDLSESTLYPVLRRLQKEGLLTTYDQAYQGRNRRYYQITEKGLLRHAYYQQEWQTFKSQVDQVMKGGENR